MMVTTAIVATAFIGVVPSALARSRIAPDVFSVELTAAKSAMMAEPQKAYDHARAAFALAQNISVGQQRSLAITSATWLSGEALVRLKKPQDALPLLDDALMKASTNSPRSKLQGDVLKSHGRAEEALGRVAQALQDFQAAYKVYQQANEPRGQAMALQEIGSIYSDARDYAHVLQYYAQSTDTFSQDPNLILVADNNRGFALKDLGRHSEAEAEFRKALALAKAMQSGSIQTSILENIAFTESLEGKSAAARADIIRGLALASKDPEARGERPFLLGILAKISADAGDFKTAAALLDQTFKGVKVDKTPFAYRDFHEIAARVYEQEGMEAKALSHLKAFKRLDDEGRALAASTNAALVGAKFDFANQATKIAELKAGELKRDVLLAQSKARFATIIISVLLLAGLTVTALITHAFFSVRRSRNKIRAVNGELQTMNGALQKALKAKTEFLATTSHEIRTPLNGILGMTQVMLADRAVTGDTRSRLEVVKSAGDTMSALVNDLLDVAKIETGNLSVQRRELDLKNLLQDVARMWADKAEIKGLQFRLELDSCPVRVVEDGDRLRQILFNLLSNATKFTEQGSVTLSASCVASADGDRLLIRVSDTGIGIPDDQTGHIFESFTQVDGGTSRQFGGTGLGLTICRNLASAMGGDILVKSSLGEGSEFTVNLPLTRCAMEQQARHAGPGGLNSTFLVIVEDNPLAQSMLRATLQPKVRRLEFARSIGAVADPVLAGFDRVLVDGACLARQHPDDPIAAVGQLARSAGAAVTALWPTPSAEDGARLKIVGADQVLAKPMTSADLIAALETVCSGHGKITTIETVAA